MKRTYAEKYTIKNGVRLAVWTGYENGVERFKEYQCIKPNRNVIIIFHIDLKTKKIEKRYI